ncbi:hypothetical protein Lepto7376_0685 [[Leptolyngbya] sp. PCC 7376]|nr:hypothetical protein Lepto7376_0685 [[Leptolyngbya] sp. PCC 7376]
MNLINFSELEKLYAGDKAFQQEIVTNFVKRIPTYVDCLKVSLHKQDVEELLVFSCQLRATAKCCCVEEVHQLCLLLEKQVSANEFVSANMTLRKIQKMLFFIQNTYPKSI